MTCHVFRAALTRYVDDRLDAAERRQFDEHIAGCEGCAKQLDLTRRAAAVLAAAGPAEPPADLAARITRAALSGPRGSRAADRPGFVQRWLAIGRPAAVVASLAAAALTGLYVHRDRGDAAEAEVLDPVATVGSMALPAVDSTSAEVLAVEAPTHTTEAPTEAPQEAN